MGMDCVSNGMVQNKALIIGILSLSLCLISGISFCQASDSSDALNSYKELQSNFNSNQHKFSEFHPEPVFLPSSEHISSSSFGRIPSSGQVSEEIILNVTHSKKQVQDIEAINAVKQRTIVYDDIQKRDGVNNGNTLDIEITGNGWENQNAMDLDDDLGNAIEDKVDSAIASSMNHELGDKTGSINRQINNLNIDVSGISVRAVNTVQGGSAIATSNIIIEPVQIIVEPSEASEKLK
jgi:hypothetical protein